MLCKKKMLLVLGYLFMPVMAFFSIWYAWAANIVLFFSSVMLVTMCLLWFTRKSKYANEIWSILRQIENCKDMYWDGLRSSVNFLLVFLPSMIGAHYLTAIIATGAFLVTTSLFIFEVWIPALSKDGEESV